MNGMDMGGGVGGGVTLKDISPTPYTAASFIAPRPIGGGSMSGINWGIGISNPMQGLNQGLASLGEALKYTQEQDRIGRQEARQATLDQMAMKTHEIQDLTAQINLDDALAKQKAKIQASGGDLNQHYLQEQQLERVKQIGDFLNHTSKTPGGIKGSWPLITKAFPELADSKPEDFKAQDGLITEDQFGPNKEFLGRVIYDPDKKSVHIMQPPKPEAKGFDSIDMGDKVKIIPRDGSKPYYEKKGVSPTAAAKQMGVNINGLTPEENAALDRAIQNGLDPYKVNSRTGKIYAQQELLNPGRDWNKLGAQAAFERSQTTMNTRALLNTVNPLLDKLEQAGGVLGNSSLPGYNKAVNFLKEQTGQADIVGFNNLRDDVVAEVERGLLGTGVLSDSKYLRAVKNINSAQSLPQLKAAVANTKMVISARLESLAKGPNPTPPNQGRNSAKADPLGIR